MSIACLDAHYRGEEARTACLLFEDWNDECETSAHVHHGCGIADYASGEFYRRELPGLLAVLAELPEKPELIIVDGFVWLNSAGDRAGLGARLHAEVEVPVVGVAKTAFIDPGGAILPVLRGTSQTPLFITAIDYAVQEAAARVVAMHGLHRIPTLLKRVDQLARGLATQPLKRRPLSP